MYCLVVVLLTNAWKLSRVLVDEKHIELEVVFDASCNVSAEVALRMLSGLCHDKNSVS